MDQRISLFTFMCVAFIPFAESAVPGTFFWKPRLALDLTRPKKTEYIKVHKPTIDNIRNGVVVIIDGYSVGLTVIALVSSISTQYKMPHTNPMSAYYYTDVYRWALRYISLLPEWSTGNGGHYCNTHKVWKKRFYYMDALVPEWMRKALFFVDKDEWKKEDYEFKRFQRYAEPAFGKHYMYPTKTFNNFASQRTEETIENMDRSSISIKLR